jgi:hypothetical protein
MTQRDIDQINAALLASSTHVYDIEAPPMTDKLGLFELDLLRELNGEPTTKELRWGAAMGVAIEYFYEKGYVARTIGPDGIRYVITDKGKAVLKEFAHD